MAPAAKRSAPRSPRTARRETPAVPPAGEEDSNGWRARVVTRSLERATKKSIDRGAAFITATLALLRESGDTSMTVQQIADRAGQSVRTFYQHFESKDDLLLAVFEEELKRHARELRAAVEEYPDPTERLAAFMLSGATAIEHDVEGTVGENIAFSRLNLELAAARPDDLAALQQPVVALARELITGAVEAGAIPQCDPESAAYIMVTLKDAYLHSKILGNVVGARLPSPAELARFTLEGLRGTFPARFA